MRHRFDFDTLREIGDSLFRNKRRTILTGFGIFWGLFMLLFLVGGGKGLKQSLSLTFDAMLIKNGKYCASGVVTFRSLKKTPRSQG